jgi:glycosyltransferase involved in cell wall biosynthesis
MARDSRALPGISVIICTYNRADLLPEAIENVLAQEGIAADAFELVVVDNNSNDGTREVVTAFGASRRLGRDQPDGL